MLNDSLQKLKYIGKKRADAFATLGINTIRDLLYYFPSKHIDRTNILTAPEAYYLTSDGYEGEMTVVGKVVKKDKKRFGKKEMLIITFTDEKGFFECIWFSMVGFFESRFNENTYYAISTKPQISKNGTLQFSHPDFDVLGDDESEKFFNTGKIIPIYRIPKELKSSNIGDFSMRKIMADVVTQYASALPETLPDELIESKELYTINDAVKQMHFPDTSEKLLSAQKRFKFEELFYFEILVALRRAHHKTLLNGHAFEIDKEIIKKFLDTLPFELTEAQTKVLHEIRLDMENPLPMNRLLQGDVGSGKTIVALIAMLMAVSGGFQTVLMAPTEILADQHAKKITEILQPLNDSLPPDKTIKTALLLGGMKKAERAGAIELIESGEAKVIIGTHALFEDVVTIPKLGLVVIDEQHRFGVDQRARLVKKAGAPDVLVMSATPIPRTLSLTLYGDLDVSIIDSLPKNRKPIKTFLMGDEKLTKIYERIVERRKEGYRSYIVYPLVEESEKIELKAAQEYYESLKETYFKSLRVGLIHGKMKWQDKEEQMLAFASGEYDVLIATTVIEVGIDVPDANIIVINDAHRFGLSQLHQLRGRVGRGTQQAYCILVTKDEIAEAANRFKGNIAYLSPAQVEKYKSSIRLQTMVAHTDGFRIAETDLKLRGPGDIFGTKQSGYPNLQFADLSTDMKILEDAKKEAFTLVAADPDLSNTKNQIISTILKQRYIDNLRYAQIA